MFIKRLGGGVSVVFAGHVHAYERSRPVCLDRVLEEGEAPTYVTIGDGGNREQLYDVWSPREERPWSAFRNGTRFGFGTLTFVNDSVANWDWLPNLVGEVRDSVLIHNVPKDQCHFKDGGRSKNQPEAIFIGAAAAVLAVLCGFLAGHYSARYKRLKIEYDKTLQTIELEGINSGDPWAVDDGNLLDNPDRDLVTML